MAVKKLQMSGTIPAATVYGDRSSLNGFGLKGLPQMSFRRDLAGASRLKKLNGLSGFLNSPQTEFSTNLAALDKLVNNAMNNDDDMFKVLLENQSDGIDQNELDSMLPGSDLSLKEFKRDILGQKTFGEKAKGLNDSLASINAGGIAGNLMAGIGNVVGKENTKKTGDQQAVQSAILGTVSMIPGYGQLIAAGLGGLELAGNALGFATSNVDSESAKRVGGKGLSNDAKVQNALGYVPGASALAGGIGAAFFGGGKGKSYSISDDAMAMADGYGASVADLQATEDIAGKGWFGRWARRKANRAVDSARETDRLLADLNRTNTQRKESTYYQDLQNQNINRYAGENYLGMRVGREGFKLMTTEEVRRIIAARNGDAETEKLQNGGTIPSDVTVMPTGSLHKERHHIEEENPVLEDVITKKGIPVITKTETGDLEAVAEIERDEIILSKSLTEQIEALYKDGSEEAMIQAGKLLAEEIIMETIDPNNKIDANGDAETENKR